MLFLPMAGSDVTRPLVAGPLLWTRQSLMVSSGTGPGSPTHSVLPGETKQDHFRCPACPHILYLDSRMPMYVCS